tara:strand:- start:46 stop:759 length:714 start_codon:yes stop_codon:yes gene_type:complete
MTKIKNYPIDTNISVSDKWIGSDSNQSNRTKNFSVGGLADFYNKNASIRQTNSLLFFYDTVAVGETRSAGSFSFPTEIGASVPFSSITSLVFSENSKNGPYIVDFMESMVSGDILIQSTSNSNFFAYYKLTSFDQDVSEPKFYNAVLSFVSGNGSIEEDGDYFVSLLQFEDAGDKNYVHSQNVAATTWSIQHNLGKFASATAVLSTNQKGYGDVNYIDKNNLTITFASAETGKAFIN